MKTYALLCIAFLSTPWHGFPFELSKRQLYKNIQGEYQGLVYSDEPADTHANSAYFSFKVRTDGSLKGRFYLGGRGFVLDQFVNELGQADVALTRGDLWDGDLDFVALVKFQFDPSGLSGDMRADVSDFNSVPAGWLFSITGYRAPFHAIVSPAPQAGSYTTVLSGPGTVPETSGSGFATVTVDRNGTVSVSGFLPDGRSFSHRTRLGLEGQWPCYVRLYNRAGSLVGWLRFSSDTADTPSGSVIWTHPAVSPLRELTAQRLNPTSSPYAIQPSGTPILNLAEGALVLSGPGFEEPLTNTFLLNGQNKVTDTGTNRLRLTFNKRTGTFAGSIVDPISRKRLPVKGAVLQRLNCGSGYFLLSNKSTGNVWLGPVATR